MENSLEKDLKTIGTADTHARTSEQHAVMEKAIQEKKCPFCPPYEFKNPFLWEGEFWSLKHNDMPYEGHECHFVFIYKKHTNDILQVPPVAWREIAYFFRQPILLKNRLILGGAIVIRFGLSEYNASTIRHLHGHIQQISLTTTKKRIDKPETRPLHLATKDFPWPLKWEDSQIEKIGNWIIKRMNKKRLQENLLEHFAIFSEIIPDNVYFLGTNNWEWLGLSIQYCIREFKIPGGGIVIPFGTWEFNTRFTTRTYAEILVPQGPNMNVRAEFVPGFYRAGATLSKDPSRKKEREKRLAEFEEN